MEYFNFFENSNDTKKFYVCILFIMCNQKSIHVSIYNDANSMIYRQFTSTLRIIWATVTKLPVIF